MGGRPWDGMKGRAGRRGREVGQGAGRRRRGTFALMLDNDLAPFLHIRSQNRKLAIPSPRPAKKRK